MTIEHVMGGFGYDITCDICGQTTFYDEECFEWAVSASKRDGWQYKKDDYNEWINICPPCQGENE